MKNVLKYIGLVIATLVFSFLTSTLFGELYNRVFKQSGTYIDLRSLSGLPFAYIFFLTLIFTAFGGAKKYWWIGILLIPAVAFELYFDLAHFYFPLALALLGWVLGLSISKLMKK